MRGNACCFLRCSTRRRSDLRLRLGALLRHGYVMGFFDIFRRPPPVRDAAELADFIDQQAAFVAQKGIYEYSRARAGHYAKILFKEPEFQTAADVSRWQTFPLGLAMVGELVEGALLPAWPADRPALVDTVRALVLGGFRSLSGPGRAGLANLDKAARRPRPAPQASGAASAQVGEGHPRAVLGDAISI